MTFASPLFLVLLIPVITAMITYAFFRESFKGSFRFSDIGFMEKMGSSFSIKMSRNLYLVRIAALILMVIAFARPRIPNDETKIFIEGIDIVLAIDTSGSMQAMDFEIKGKRYDRLTVVKNAVKEFIDKRKNDRMGIVAFSANTYTICPLTLDHEWLLSNLERVKMGMMEDGTSIGSAIAASLNRLKDSKSKKKVIILLTDGMNNSGKISPINAAEAAHSLGIRIYTIGAGSKGLAPFPVKDSFGRTILQPMEIEIDEDLLRRIAKITGGRYFRATDTDSLRSIYKEIDKLEKTKIEENGYRKYNELFDMFLFPALFLLLFEILLSRFFLRRLP